MHKMGFNYFLPEIVLHLALRALPAGANSKGGVDALGRMQGPVINDFRILLLGLELLAINKELDVWELDGDGVVMPLIVTNLKVTQKYYVSSFDLTALIQMIKTTKKLPEATSISIQLGGKY